MPGYIELYRDIYDWEWYGDIKTCRLFIHLLLRVNHQRNQWQGITVDRGQTVASYSILAQESKLSVKSVRNSINKLKRTGELAVKSTNKYSVITVLNYNRWQSRGKQDGRQGAGKGQARGRQGATNNNDNNEKNDKNIATSKNVASVNPTNHIIGRFQLVNPSYKTLYANKTQRACIERMIKQHGYEKMVRVVDSLPGIIKQPYSPRITTPLQLESKFGDLIAFVQAEKAKKAEKKGGVYDATETGW